MTRFYDTCALLELQDKVFDQFFYISEITILEMNRIKEDKSKTDELRYKVRNMVRLLHENKDKYKLICFHSEIQEHLKKVYFNYYFSDIGIIASASYCNLHKEYFGNDEIIFCTYDLLCEEIASNIFNLKTEWAKDNYNKDNLYLGYKIEKISDEDYMDLINGNCKKDFGCIKNEYFIPIDRFGNSKSVFKMKDNNFEEIKPISFKSKLMGNVKPLDLVQLCAFDSIEQNSITVLYGKSGSGKTTIPLSYIMKGIENQKFRKLHIIYHYEPLKGAKTLGYEKGDHIEKLLKTGSIGNILTSKFGDMSIVESMIQNGKLDIIPTANIRGVEFGSDDVVYCTESQNIDTYTLKTIIQRCKSGCKQIYEGDILEQTDISGISGMFKMIDIFKGHEEFGCIKLKNRYRDTLSDLADKLY